MKKKKTNGFIKLEHDLVRSVAWRSTSTGARCLLLEIWARHNGKNNGAIPFGHREAVKILGISKSTATKLFQELQAQGFLVPTRRGSFDWKSGAAQGRATEWRLTMLPYDGTEPTHDLLQEKTASPLNGEFLEGEYGHGNET